MKILVAGATGALGRRIVPRLLADGYQVTAVGRARARLDALEAMGATAVAADLLDAGAVRAAMQGHDVAINVATRVPAPNRMLLPGAWREMNRIRTRGSAILADAVLELGVARLIQESFAPIYPDRGSEWITEDTPVKLARYNRSVADAEASAARVAKAMRIAVTLRFGLLYGAGDPFVDTMIASLRRGWAPFIGDPDGYVALVTHDDAAAAVVAALQVPTGTYNVVDDEPMTRRELATDIATMLGVPAPRFLPRWIGRLGGSLGETLSRSQRISNRKLREASGWRPETPNARIGVEQVLQQRSEPIYLSTKTRAT
jgi:2-alkyl-3-oxoalkanoate reductase